MSAELAVVPDHAPAPVVTTTEHFTNPTGGRLVAWAEAARAAAQLGTSLSKTTFVPATFRGKPEECAAAIMCGDELGLSPLAALRSIFVINGTPGMYARTMVAVVQSLGHEVVTVVDTPTKVTVKGRRRGSEEWTTSEWTTDRARRAGYTSNRKYESDPQAMLYARAASDVCRRIAADALLGIPYSAEELELEAPAATTRVTRATTTTKVQRETPEPDLDEPVATTPEPDVQEPAAADVTPLITEAQTRKLGVLMRDAGITERDDALRYCADVTGRYVSSRSELTKDEASRVIDALTADTTPEPTLDGE